MDCRDARGVLPADEHELQQQLIDMLPSQEGTEAMVALCCSNSYERYLTSIAHEHYCVHLHLKSCDWDFGFYPTICWNIIDMCEASSYPNGYSVSGDSTPYGYLVISAETTLTTRCVLVCFQAKPKLAFVPYWASNLVFFFKQCLHTTEGVKAAD